MHEFLAGNSLADIFCRCKAIFLQKKHIFVLCAVFLICTTISAQEQPSNSELIVTVLFDMAPEEGSPGLDSLFLDSLGIEFGLTGLRLSDSDTPDIRVRITYKADSTTIAYRLAAEVVEDGSILYSVESRETLSFQLDRVLLSQARRIAGLVGDYARQNQIPLPGEILDTEGSTTGSEEDSPRAEIDKNSTGQDEDSIEKSEDQTAPPVTVKPDAYAPGPRLALDAGFGVFLALGEPARYFKSGYTLETFAGYRFSAPFSTSLGLSISALYYIVDGYATDARGLVASIGPGLRLKPEGARGLVPGFKVNMGAALFMVSLEGDDTRIKVIPSADTAMTVDFVFGRLALQVSLGMKLMYEDANLLYGFVPGFGIAF